MERNCMADLLAWKKDPDRKPLLLQGARQVGKTWIIKEFGRLHYEDCAYFSLDEEPDLVSLFASTKDPDRILDILAVQHGKPILAGSSLLVLDEIQVSSFALNALKYFCEKRPDIHLITSGSHLGISLGARNGGKPIGVQHRFDTKSLPEPDGTSIVPSDLLPVNRAGFPVGLPVNRAGFPVGLPVNPAGFPVGKVNFLTLRPMNFEEFLLADAAENLAAFLLQAALTNAIPDILFNRLLEKWRIYMLTGGMPSAVLAWVAGRDMNRVEQRQQEILLSYERDISKYVSGNLMAKVWNVWQTIPGQLAKENKKYVYASIREGARAKDYEDAIAWISATGTIRTLSRIEKAGIPLSAYDNPQVFKIYYGDVGLLRQKVELDRSAFLQENHFFTEFKGALAENYILQELAGQYRSVYFWSSGAQAEVDFVVQQGSEVLPIEVKSGENVHSKSLRVMMERYKIKQGIRFSLRNVDARGDILNLPIFMAGQLKRLMTDVSIG